MSNVPIGSIFGGTAAQVIAQNQQNQNTLIAQLTAQAGFSGVPSAAVGWSGAMVAAPEHRDPFEYATEVAMKQPSDKKWRRFQHALFLRDDVLGVESEGASSIKVHLRMCAMTYMVYFTLPFECRDSVQWFAEHVINMEFPNSPHAT